MSTDKSIAHKYDMNRFGRESYPGGLVDWRGPINPDIQKGITTGRLRSCGYCGSMHPADIANAIRSGAKGHWADFKYGWPHKAYFDDIPNPHAGMLESRTGTSHPSQKDIDSGKMIQVPTGTFNRETGKPEYRWTEAGEPAPSTTYGKFYTVHLQDASVEDRDIIERHLGLKFKFEDSEKGRTVSWERYASTESA